MPSKYQLKNGLNVLLLESNKSPVVSVQMWVKTGSADEKKGIEQGISHFIEHLVFKGSEKFNVGEIAQTIEGSGGVLNAYTTFDQTVFYVTLSSAFVDSGLEVISEMMGRPRFDEAEINNEREVVIEEIKRSLDSPHQQASRLLFSTLYKKHPYGVPVIGYDDNIRRVSRKKILEYYNNRYVPSNMNLVVVGDFKTPEMKKRVVKFFADIPKHKLMKVKRVIEPARKAPLVKVQKSQFNESFLYLCFPAPDARSKDSTALMALAAILGQGDSSRLVHEVRNSKNLVNSIGASIFSPRDLGFFAFSSSLNHINLEKTLSEITDVVARFIEDGPTEEEIKKAIKQMESEKFYSMETVDGQAGLYGHFEFVFDNYKYFEKVLKETSALTASDVQRVARKYLNPKAITASYLSPEDEKSANAKIKVWLKDFDRAISKAKKKPQQKLKKIRNAGINWKPKARAQATQPERIVLDSGARIVGQKIAGSPVTSLRFGFLGGLRFEDPRDTGTNELTSRIWTSGTKKLNEYEFNNEVENMAASLGGFGGRNSIGISASTLQPFFDPIFGLISDVLTEPRLPAEAVEREKLMMKEYIKTRNDKPSQRCLLAMMKMLFGDHPYARDPIGENDNVDRLSRDKVSAHLQKLVLPKNMVVSAVGDLDIDELADRIDQLSKQLPKSVLPNNEHKMAAFNENKKGFIHLDREQSHIALAYRGLTFKDQDRYALEVMQAILSGQGGRLFIELRDKKSLAYSVSPIRMDGIESGYFGAYIGCSPEKGDTAVKMMFEQFKLLIEEPVGDVELDRAKRYLLGRHDIGRQRTGHVADSFLFDELYGLKFDESEQFAERLKLVTAESIQRVAKRIFTQNYVISVAGKTDVSI